MKFEKLYLFIGTLLSGVLACHTDLLLALCAFAVITTLDTLTAIHASAFQRGVEFAPLKLYFWKQITSAGLRAWTKKVFAEYGVYLIIAFVISEWILKNIPVLEIFERRLTLPVMAVYLFCLIEMWSVGENIEKAGGVNLFKRILHLLPEKIQQLFKKQ